MRVPNRLQIIEQGLNNLTSTTERLDFIYDTLYGRHYSLWGDENDNWQRMKQTILTDL
jgi:hypothetical protein